MPTSDPPYAGAVTSAAAFLLPGTGYELRSGRSDAGRPRVWGTTPPGHTHDRARRYLHRWLPEENDAPVCDSVSGHARKRRKYCQYRQSGVPAILFLPVPPAPPPALSFLRAEACL